MKTLKRWGWEGVPDEKLAEIYWIKKKSVLILGIPKKSTIYQQHSI